MIAVGIWRTGLKMPLLFVYVVLACPYQLHVVQFGVDGAGFMLALRVVAAAEAIALATSRARTLWISALATVAALLCLAGPVRYIAVHQSVTTGAAVALTFAVLIDQFWGLDCRPLYRHNLRLMMAWFWCLTLNALVDGRLITMDQWVLARWPYCFAMIIIAGMYLAKPPQNLSTEK